MPWHSLPLGEVFARLKTSANGLTKEQARARLRKYGKNELRERVKLSPIKLLAEQFCSGLILILIIATLISAIFGHVLDACLIAVIVFANGIFGFVQNYKAEQAIRAMKRLAAPSALVIRDGREKKVSARLVVPGDVISLREGDVVPADSRIIRSVGLKADESALTGESVGVNKIAGVIKDVPLAERRNMLYASTTVIRGYGRAVVVATGMETEIGRIAARVQEIKKEKTPFQVEVDRLGRRIGIIVTLICAFILLINILFAKIPLFQAFLVAIALAVAAIPEGLPAIVTLTLALGVRKMAAKKALARRMRVVESLGTVNVICADKTGTLTENKMTVREIWFNRRLIRVTGRGYEKVGKFILDEKELDPQELFPILRAGMLCNNSQAGEKFQGDPTEIALLISASKAGLEKEELEEKYKRVRELVFTPARKMMTTVHKIKRKEISFTKGAPEVVLKKCDRIYLDGKIKKVSSKLRHEILAANEQLAGKALRVLGFAYNEGFRKRPEQRMIFLGLQAMADPPRREVAGAIKECQQAGIRIIMITGDNKVTAQAIAKEIGLGTRTLEGKDLDRISDARLSVLAEKVDIFARVTPAHKLRILKALREKKHIIAMTGDGVNDAPALKAAEVGIAMGIRGTDVAKETADMILLDDNFATIRDAVREGRRIFDNLRKFVNYLLPTNLAEVFVIFLASLFGYMPLTVVQILWVNLLTDGFPALALGADPAAPGIMSRPPRPKGEGVINRRLAFLIAAIGTKKTAILLAIFFASLPLGLAVAQTTVFTGFVLYELVRIGVIRQQERLSFFSNKWLLLAIGCSLAAQLAVIYTPLSHFFGTVPLGLFSWALLLLGVVIGWIAAIGITRAVIRWTG